MAQQLLQRHNSAEQDVERHNAEALWEDASLEAVRLAFQDATTLATAAAADIADKKVSLARLEEEANGLRTDRRLTDLSLDIDPERLADLERVTLLKIGALNAEVAKLEADAAELRQQASGLAQELASTRASLATLRTAFASLQKAITQVTARLSEAGFPLDSDENAILATMAEESRVQARLLALRDSASSLELALDTATTAAALTRMSQSVRNKERALATATGRRDEHDPWLNYFEEVSRVVASRQSEAIASFTREYGPRTSVIQQRLRSVYGFDDIEIHSHASAITVRVKRGGEELRPTDYFSQSQQQTLLLGLFLTACISQTWSAFCPVLLDDPVTHFDDLNTYAFLDLIVGLIEAEPERRQFVISTCDEKLLQLAQRKFRHLGDRAIYYRFSAIGAEGPVVDQLHHP